MSTQNPEKVHMSAFACLQSVHKISTSHFTKETVPKIIRFHLISYLFSTFSDPSKEISTSIVSSLPLFFAKTSPL